MSCGNTNHRLGPGYGAKGVPTPAMREAQASSPRPAAWIRLGISGRVVLQIPDAPGSRRGER